jgi:hypothetical protein
MYLKFMKWRIQLTKKGWAAVIIGLLLGLVLLILAWTLGLFALLLGGVVILANILWAALIWLVTQLGLLSLVGWLVAQLSALMAWFAGTWLGSLILPAYSSVAPLIAKFAPAITIGKWGKALWKKVRRLRQQGHQEIQKSLENKP